MTRYATIRRVCKSATLAIVLSSSAASGGETRVELTDLFSGLKRLEGQWFQWSPNPPDEEGRKYGSDMTTWQALVVSDTTIAMVETGDMGGYFSSLAIFERHFKPDRIIYKWFREASEVNKLAPILLLELLPERSTDSEYIWRNERGGIFKLRFTGANEKLRAQWQVYDEKRRTWDRISAPLRRDKPAGVAGQVSGD